MDEMDIRTPLAEFGNVLREERVRCGYTVDEVASRLKITSRMVRAIEEGDMASMPHAVYARGFIRAYAKLFGMSDDDVRAACVSLTDSENEPPQEHFNTVRRTSSGGGKKALLCIPLLGLLAFGGYQAYTHKTHEVFLNLVSGSAAEKGGSGISAPMAEEQEKSSGSPTDPVHLNNPAPERQADSSASPSSPTERGENASLPAAAAEPVHTPAPVVPAPVPAPQPASTPEQVAPRDPRSEALTLQTGNGTGMPIVASPAGKRHQIILTALAECWVHSSADDMDTRQLSIQKGETFSLSFDRKLVIKLGNAGGVRMKYDGRELLQPGKMGQVKTLVFPQAAVELSGATD